MEGRDLGYVLCYGVLFFRFSNAESKTRSESTKRRFSALLSLIVYFSFFLQSLFHAGQKCINVEN